MKLGTERRLGATDAAKLLGVSRYGNAADVYARVVLGLETPSTPAMDRGTRYEPVVRDLYKAEHSVELMQWVTRPVILQHPERDYLTASPDDVTVDGRLVELKTVGGFSHASWRDGPPPDYIAQCIHGMLVGDLASCHLYAAFGEDVGSEFRIDYCRTYLVERDAEFEALIIEACERFWFDCVVPRRPPDMAPLKGKRAWKTATKNAAREVAP